MSRLVRRPQSRDLDQPIAETQGAVQAVAGDNYLERMVKYVPAEVVAFSMVINAILDQTMKSGGADANMAGCPVFVVAAGALLVGLILTPLFCWYVREDGDAWIVNAAVSTLAFPFWAYLMGAVAFSRFHDGNLAAILILTFTVVSGVIAPLPVKLKRQEQQAAVPQPAMVQPVMAQATLATSAMLHTGMPKDGPRLVEALTR
jgi:hypothetical protein